MDLLCFFSLVFVMPRVIVSVPCYVVRVCLFVPYGHLLGKG